MPRGRRSCVGFEGMVQRIVKREFHARQLLVDPPTNQAFGVGELIYTTTPEEGGNVEFVRDSDVLSKGRPTFITVLEQLGLCTHEHPCPHRRSEPTDVDERRCLNCGLEYKIDL